MKEETDFPKRGGVGIGLSILLQNYSRALTLGPAKANRFGQILTRTKLF